MDNLSSFNPNEWVKKYADALYAYTVVRVNDTGIAEDIVQNTFLSAWKARDTYQGQASEKNWLYAICKNKIIDHYRKQSKNIVQLSNKEEGLYFDEVEHWTAETKPKEWGMDYDQPVETKEFYSILDMCKQKLKDIQQAVFVMKYMEDLEAEEICKALNITASNYWVLVHRAKLHLRKCMEKNWVNIN
jgi:RNA polymerase sigma-70 factor (TIGR02943 family)